MALNQMAFLAPQTAAATSGIFDASDCDAIVVSADNLAGAETVGLRVMSGANAKQVTDIYAVAINLSATLPDVALEGGAQYQFVKSVTAGLWCICECEERLMNLELLFEGELYPNGQGTIRVKGDSNGGDVDVIVNCIDVCSFNCPLLLINPLDWIQYLSY